jgi:hypothetical protein
MHFLKFSLFLLNLRVSKTFPWLMAYIFSEVAGFETWSIDEDSVLSYFSAF